MKTPNEVGRDFNEYAQRWAEHEYAMEVAWTSGGIVRDDKSAEVQRPGDEWGSPAALRAEYQGLVQKFNLTDSVNVVEIGAGGGRSTQVLLDALGDAANEYHVIDVADVFVDTLRQRIQRPLDIHIVSDVDTTFLEADSIDLVLAQSSWSHIGLYDQYRYLRDLRFAMKKGAPIVVHGLFVVGAGDDWTWNRFRRRVFQIDHQIEGVYHEFTSVSMIAEMLTRLGYTDIVIFPRGFVARRGNLVGDQHRMSVDSIKYRWVSTFDGWLEGENGVASSVPTQPPATRPLPVQMRVKAGVVRRMHKLRHF
jgi:predicted O-methyltransferase YrrM